MLIIVKTPHAMTASWLQIVSELKLAHEDHVSLEDFVDRGRQVCLVVDAQLVEAEEECDEIQLVTRPVIDALVRTERFFPVDLNLWNSSFEARSRGKLAQFLIRRLDHLVHPGAVCSVTEAHRLLNRWHFVDPDGELLEQVVQWRQVLVERRAIE